MNKKNVPCSCLELIPPSATSVAGIFFSYFVDWFTASVKETEGTMRKTCEAKTNDRRQDSKKTMCESSIK